jgi:hypothetical protein
VMAYTESVYTDNGLKQIDGWPCMRDDGAQLAIQSSVKHVLS